MPAYLERANLHAAYETATRAVHRAGISDYEILIATDPRPDGRDDGTSAIADEIAQEDHKVRHVHYDRRVGLGYKYRNGVQAATKDFVMMIPAHNLTLESSLDEILSYLGGADSVITYTINPETRPLKARVVSRGFVILCNLLFGLRMKYYNGITIHRKDLLKLVPMATDFSDYMAETIIYLVKSGVTYLEVPQALKPTTRTGKAFNLMSVWRSLKTLILLFWRIHFRRIRVPIPSPLNQN